MEKRTLLLTPWYFPIKVIGWRDAIKMKYEGTVDIIVEYDEEVSSPSITWHVPAVIRLRKLTGSAKKKGVKFSRQNVYARDGYQCQYCGCKPPVRELSYDHVVPSSCGGRTIWENIVTACISCNSKKGNKSCDDAGMWPMNKPYRPASLPMSAPIIDRSTAPAEWQDYLHVVPA